MSMAEKNIPPKVWRLKDTSKKSEPETVRLKVFKQGNLTLTNPYLKI